MVMNIKNPFKRKSGAHKDDNPHKRGIKSIASTIALLITAPILAILMTIYVFQSYEVFGSSMETTLQDGDRLIVQKFAKNWANLLGNNYEPARYEVIVFDRPRFVADSTGKAKHLIKRVIGLPGDRVVVSNGGVTIFNDENPEGYNPDDGQEYAGSIVTTPGNVDIYVNTGELFVLGDNRGNSQDSRSFGSIQTNAVIGSAELRFTPVRNFGTL